MPKLKVRYVGLDVHKDSIVIAVAEVGRDAARDVGMFPSDWVSFEKQLKRLSDGFTLKLCYEAGPTPGSSCIGGSSKPGMTTRSSRRR